MTIRATAHARYDLWYHLVWATKYRKKVFKDYYVQERVKYIIQAIASQYDMHLGVIECTPDHIHMSLSAPPRIAPSRAVQILKSVSTKVLFKEMKWLRSQYWGGEVWSQGYFIRSVGPGLTLEQIERYVLEQSEEL